MKRLQQALLRLSGGGAARKPLKGLHDAGHFSWRHFRKVIGDQGTSLLMTQRSALPRTFTPHVAVNRKEDEILLSASRGTLAPLSCSLSSHQRLQVARWSSLTLTHWRRRAWVQNCSIKMIHGTSS
ncbi:hypothetical protein E2C01_083562 [Portunus trituberculatus]|uniref:Uncharacterized protein n=1 Tax=Portunus trituberculatus TaxID=210409 RepID=A0A5B7J3U8_PORTR|nr:hypothetical protein [Portunus trituberculatus]